MHMSFHICNSRHKWANRFFIGRRKKPTIDCSAAVFYLQVGIKKKQNGLAPVSPNYGKLPTVSANVHASDGESNTVVVAC